MQLNHRALRLCRRLCEAADSLHVRIHTLPSGVRVIDCGVEARGGLEAGRLLAEICLAGLGAVEMLPPSHASHPWPLVTVRTDWPLEACLLSQYAGWPVQLGDFFAMASGPLRVARGREPLLEKLGHHESCQQVVGVLETGVLPTDPVGCEMAEQCRVAPQGLTLLVAPTASLAGSLQVVARSVETGLHKLAELGFDPRRVHAAFGSAPLPPIAADDLQALGRTNDAVLYGAEITLWVTGSDAGLNQIAEQIPSCASPEYGEPFLSIFQRHDRDFYQIDPMLFSPAAVVLHNLETGTTWRAGRVAPDILERSFLP